MTVDRREILLHRVRLLVETSTCDGGVVRSGWHVRDLAGRVPDDERETLPRKRGVLSAAHTELARRHWQLKRLVKPPPKESEQVADEQHDGDNRASDAISHAAT
jgi:hypothetical protein